MRVQYIMYISLCMVIAAEIIITNVHLSEFVYLFDFNAQYLEEELPISNIKKEKYFIIIFFVENIYSYSAECFLMIESGD